MLKLNECYKNLIPTLWYNYHILNKSGAFISEGKIRLTKKGKLEITNITGLIRYMKSDGEYKLNIF